MGNHKMNALTTIEVVPYVMTWDGLVTKRHTECRMKLGVSDRMEGQLQRICLQQTYDFVMMELSMDTTTLLAMQKHLAYATININMTYKL
ncbi:hypothetical protein X943_001556 [Babesia divergens]|uniref:Uncharacterized protein n=1 Tax=Babesia divergens TaxID=32595 RepID=A0AAD9GFN8_BABDI|nr:hypothetical protein X943_001556 [Babesia divergens]